MDPLQIENEIRRNLARLTDKIDSLARENIRLTSELFIYGDHHHCPCRLEPILATCTCGWDARKKELEEKATPRMVPRSLLAHRPRLVPGSF